MRRPLCRRQELSPCRKCQRSWSLLELESSEWSWSAETNQCVWLLISSLKQKTGFLRPLKHSQTCQFTLQSVLTCVYPPVHRGQCGSVWALMLQLWSSWATLAAWASTWRSPRTSSASCRSRASSSSSAPKSWEPPRGPTARSTWRE